MRILFVTTGVVGMDRLASFHRADVDLLTGLGHEVRVLRWIGRPVLRLWRESRQADLVFCWNISDHAFAASFLRRPLVCVIGGYEFANLPECDYGNLRTRPMRFITRSVWRRADALLYVDPSLIEEATRAFGHAGRAFYVPTGYDAEFWASPDAPREDLVVTVCHAPDWNRIRLKGVDVFVDAARLLPEMEFIVAGETPKGFDRDTLPKNVRLVGWLDPESLRRLYGRSKVYCQLSLHEGLPNAVCEAMLCGCVPVGTSVNGNPTAIGDAGYLVDRNPGAVVDSIRRAASDAPKRARARERIVSMFPLDRRRKLLAEILEETARGR